VIKTASDARILSVAAVTDSDEKNTGFYESSSINFPGKNVDKRII
jgi:hypothetical protein